MDEMEEKLGSILGNPELMSQIMAMAQTLNQQQAESQPSQEPSTQQSPPSRPKPSQNKAPPAQQKNTPSIGKNEIEMIQKFSALSRQTGLDHQQQALLKALNPYLSHDRLGKLEKAMHAAKLAKFASSALEQSGGQLKFGR